MHKVIQAVGLTTIGLALSACGGSSGGGSGSSVPAEHRAAFAAAAATGLAEMGRDMALDARDYDDDDAGASLRSASAPCDSGSYNESTMTVTSPYYTGSLLAEVVEANQCRNDAGGMGEMYMHGRTVYGEAEGGRVFHFQAGGPGGDGDWVSRSDFMQMESRLRAVMDVCDGCAQLGTGAFEQRAYYDGEFTLFGDRFRFSFGRSAEDRMVMTASAGTPMELTLNGRLGFEAPGNDCNFVADYTTHSPMLVTGNDMIVGGEVDIALQGAGDYNVQFLSDGSVQVNGQVITEEQLLQTAARCDFEYDDEWDDDWD